MTSQTHNTVIAAMIERREFVGWQGLSRTLSPDALFGLGVDTVWGEQKLGSEFLRARSHVLEMEGYYRPTVYAREGAVVMFDGMNPQLAPPWNVLQAEFGAPDSALDWSYDGIALAEAELIFASRGITVFLNTANGFVVFVSLFEPTTVDHYVRHLRIERSRRRGRRATP